MGQPNLNQRVDVLEERLSDLNESVTNMVSNAIEKALEAMRHSLAEFLTEGQTLETKKLGTKMENLASHLGQEYPKSLIDCRKSEQIKFQSDLRCTFTEMQSSQIPINDKYDGSGKYIGIGSSGVLTPLGGIEDGRGCGGQLSDVFGGCVKRLSGGFGGRRVYGGGYCGSGSGGGPGSWRYWTLNMVVCNGTNPDGWVLRLGCYFLFYCSTYDEMLEVVAVVLEGAALIWYQWVNKKHPIRRWSDLKTFILRQVNDRVLNEQWMSTSQTTNVHLYKRKLMGTITSLDHISEDMEGMKHMVKGSSALCEPIGGCVEVCNTLSMKSLQDKNSSSVVEVLLGKLHRKDVAETVTSDVDYDNEIASKFFIIIVKNEYLLVNTAPAFVPDSKGPIRKNDYDIPGPYVMQIINGCIVHIIVFRFHQKFGNIGIGENKFFKWKRIRTSDGDLEADGSSTRSEVLLGWKHLSDHETTLEDVTTIQNQFPSFHLEDRHVEIPVPVPKKDEVLLTASINPLDWKVQKGMLWPFLPFRFPKTPLADVAGEVVETGAEVKNLKAGVKVVAMPSIFEGGSGLVEYAVANETLRVSRLPVVSAAEGAGLPVAGLTAHQALNQAARVKLDESGLRSNILITAASGGVGLYAVQLAKLGNTHVTATCGARNINLVKSLDADEFLDYKTLDGAALKSPFKARNMML